MSWKATTLSYLFFLFFLAIISGCSKDKDSAPTAPDEQDIIISDSTVVIDSTELSEPEIEGDTYTFTFTGDPPDIAVGDVMVGQTGGGYLRRVTDVSIQGNQIELTTDQASLTDAIEQGSMQDELQLRIDDGNRINSQDKLYGMEPIYLGDGVAVADGGISLDGVNLFDGTVGGVTLRSTITEGHIEFEPSLDLGFRIANCSIEEFHAIANGTLDFACTVDLYTTGEVLYEREVTVASFIVGTFVQMVGPVPIVEIVYLDFLAGFRSEIDGGGTTTVGFEFESTTSVGAAYQNSQWSSVWEHENKLERGPVEWGSNADASIRCFIKPRISVEFYSVAGPYLEVEPYLHFDGTVTGTTWEWGLYGGLDANLGFEVEILHRRLADYRTTLTNWEREIAVENGDREQPPYLKMVYLYNSDLNTYINGNIQVILPYNTEIGTRSVYYPQWSPDGERIVFQADATFPPYYQNDIYVCDADGSNIISLTNTNDFDEIHPSWTPDGNSIIFIKYPHWGHPECGDIYVADLDGNIIQQLTNDDINRFPNVSPDGSNIAFIKKNTEDIWHLYITDREGKNPVNLTPDYTSPQLGGGFGGTNGGLKWSPDGSKIAFSALNENTWSYEIFIVDIRERNKVQTTNTPDEFVGNPSWQFNGQRLLFSSYNWTLPGDGKIYYINLNGTGKTFVTEGYDANWAW